MTRKKDMINVGLIGMGVIPSLHARAYTKLDDAKLVAIYYSGEDRIEISGSQGCSGSQSVPPGFGRYRL